MMFALVVMAGTTSSSSNSGPGLRMVTATGQFSIASVPTSVAYNSIPGPLPPNVPSLGFQATQTNEFGDLIQFAGSNRSLSTVTLVMSDWALAADFGSTNPTWS
ncbi:MAG: hypothetical protein ACREDR_42545, partial [Blastocatellia bacterium]